MRIRTLVIGLASAVAFFFSVQPAAAQDKKPEFSIGYNFLRFLETDGENVPKGWAASVAAPVGSSMIKVVGDVSGNYKDGGKLHLFQGGVEFAGKNEKTKPFVRVLAGLGTFSSDGDTDTAFAFTPEFGVKVYGKGKLGAQVSLGFPILRESGDTTKTMRLFIGLTCR